MIGPYRVIEGDEERALIADLYERIPTLNKAGTVDRWEKGWRENLEAYRKSGDACDLQPKYIRKQQPMRLYGRFVMMDDPDAEANFYEKWREAVCAHFLSKCERIYEYGCGPGHNLAYLKKRFPEAKIHGLDWAWSSVEIAEAVAHDGQRVDFFNPVVPDFPSNSGVLTVGALEQTDRDWYDFMEQLIIARPAICVHLEPILEWYDPDNPVDETAIEAHKVRRFWRGFWRWLEEQRSYKRVQILQARRTGVGSLWIEGYSLIVWRPL